MDGPRRVPPLPDAGDSPLYLSAAESLQAIIAAAQIGIIVIHRLSRTIVEANAKALQLIGLARSEVLGRVCHRFICPTENGQCPIIDQGQSVDHSERVLIDRLGRRVPILKTVSECRLNGEDHLVECFFDLTERKILEEELQLLQRHTQLILGSITEGVMSFDREGRHTFLNPAALEYLGFAPDELLNRSGHDLWHLQPDGRHLPEEDCPILMTCRTGKPCNCCSVFWRKDGTSFPVEFTSTAIMEGTKILGAVVVFQDLTLRKQSEETLHQTEERYRRMVESLTNYIYTVKLENGVPVHTSHGEGCLSLTGYSPMDYQADPGLWLRMVHPEDRDQVLEHARATIAGKDPRPLEHRIIHKDGSTRWVRNTPVIHREQRQDGTVFSGLIIDITDRKMAAQQILNLNAELEKRVQSRTLELHTANLELQRLAQELAEAQSQENKIGFEIQKTLLMGNPPRRIGWADVGALTIPSLGIDGDFFDFFVHGKACFDLLFGDVMGKGIPAALVGAATKSHFQRAMLRLISRAPAMRFPSPEEIVAKVHAEMTPQLQNLERFVSLHFCRFDLRTSSLDLVNCGHTLPLHYDFHRRSCSAVATGHSPLGLNARENYRQVKVPFRAGDVFLFYSDGISDARNHAGEFFGTERLENLLSSFAHLKAQEIVNRMIKKLEAFMVQPVPWDDLTLVVVSIARV